MLQWWVILYHGEWWQVECTCLGEHIRRFAHISWRPACLQRDIHVQGSFWVWVGQCEKTLHNNASSYWLIWHLEWSLMWSCRSHDGIREWGVSYHLIHLLSIFKEQLWESLLNTTPDSSVTVNWFNRTHLHFQSQTGPTLHAGSLSPQKVLVTGENLIRCKTGVSNFSIFERIPFPN